VTSLRFEWDAVKAATNRRKHGVSFEEARSVFLDEEALLIADPEHSESEDRFVLLGLSARIRVLVVVHAYRAGTDVIRLISAQSGSPGTTDLQPPSTAVRLRPSYEKTL
jgi:uncharacterized DUF497 family protein